jgi:hypothetical protein
VPSSIVSKTGFSGVADRAVSEADGAGGGQVAITPVNGQKSALAGRR